jgi:hypothetical protein
LGAVRYLLGCRFTIPRSHALRTKAWDTPRTGQLAMQIPFHKKLEAKARASKWYGLIYLVLVFLWEALAHLFFTWFDEHILAIAGPRTSIIFRWAASHPILFFLASVVSYCTAIVVWALLSGLRRPPLEIVSLCDGEAVEYQQTVYGVTRRPKAPVQLLVFSGNDKWHPQWKTELDDYRWRGKCQFVDENSPPGSSFKVVAVSSSTEICEPVAVIPSGAKCSEIIRVSRSGTAPQQEHPGIYFGRTRRTLNDGWVPYTSQVGTLETTNTVTFKGKRENGWRYPREENQDLGPLVILGLRFKPEGEVNFYAHFRGSLTLLINSRFSD